MKVNISKIKKLLKKPMSHFKDFKDEYVIGFLMTIIALIYILFVVAVLTPE